jgi:type IV pilus assembly protein PilB
MQAAIVSRMKIMANLDISERRLPQDGRMQVLLENRLIDLRISTIPTYHGEKVVVRILDKESMLKELDKLGFSYQMLEQFSEQIERPNGIILVTGPTGSGKTTTLYSALKRINSATKNICTVENPIEYNLHMVNQIQVNEKAGLTFAGCLRSLLRQDPDIIMVGEIRDRETAQIAAQAALTGHLVLSTLHTNDAMGAVMRLINMGVEPFLLGSTLNAVVAQRLVRTICPACREEIPASKHVLQLIRKKGLNFDTVFQGKGCAKCRRSGFAGRIGLYELVVVDDGMRDVVSRNPSITELRRYGAEKKMQSLRSDGLEKVREGLTTIDEVLRVSEDTY